MAAAAVGVVVVVVAAVVVVVAPAAAEAPATLARTAPRFVWSIRLTRASRITVRKLDVRYELEPTLRRLQCRAMIFS